MHLNLLFLSCLGGTKIILANWKSPMLQQWDFFIWLMVVDGYLQLK